MGESGGNIVIDDMGMATRMVRSRRNNDDDDDDDIIL